jgi:hypothetical protein
MVQNMDRYMYQLLNKTNVNNKTGLFFKYLLCWWLEYHKKKVHFVLKIQSVCFPIDSSIKYLSSPAEIPVHSIAAP